MFRKSIYFFSQALYTILRLFNYYRGYTLLGRQRISLELAPSYTVNFTQDEQKFLEQSALSFNYIADDYSTGYRQKAIYVSKLNNITLLGNTGAIILNKKVLVDSVFNFGRMAGSVSYKDFSILIPQKLTSGLYTTIVHGHWANNNIFHWFCDCLPRIYALVNTVCEPITVIMWENAPQYQKDSLQFVLEAYPNFKVAYFRKGMKFRISEFYFSPFISNSMSGYLPMPVSSWLRTKIWEGYKVQKSEAKRRIYISRSKAKTRRVLNEPKLLPLLAKYNFEIIRAEELSYQQQVELFYNTEAVIAPHGAGLTNLLFSESCKVLEFHPANMVKTHYFLLSKGLGFDYASIIGSVGDERENYSVDVQEVEAWMHNCHTITHS